MKVGHAVRVKSIDLRESQNNLILSMVINAVENVYSSFHNSDFRFENNFQLLTLRKAHFVFNQLTAYLFYNAHNAR